LHAKVLADLKGSLVYLEIRVTLDSRACKDLQENLDFQDRLVTQETQGLRVNRVLRVKTEMTL